MEFEGARYTVSVAELASIDARQLQVVGTLAGSDYEIRRALDRLFTGF